VVLEDEVRDTLLEEEGILSAAPSLAGRAGVTILRVLSVAPGRHGKAAAASPRVILVCSSSWVADDLVENGRESRRGLSCSVRPSLDAREPVLLFRLSLGPLTGVAGSSQRVSLMTVAWLLDESVLRSASGHKPASEVKPKPGGWPSAAPSLLGLLTPAGVGRVSTWPTAKEKRLVSS
jgi:hypothetical protein